MTRAMTTPELELGLDTFGYITVDEPGQPLPPDAVSNGRAQLVVGRGSLTESFPLFGFDLADYEELFEEKLDLLTRLLREQPVTWSGKFRSPLVNQYVTPALPERHLPTWVGVGGSPQSVVRAARYGLPLMLAVIGGPLS